MLQFFVVCSRVPNNLSMDSFEGFIDRVERQGEVLSVRLVVGGFNPQPTEAPVLYVEIESPDDHELEKVLVKLQHEDSGCDLSLVSPKEARLDSEHGTEVVLRGARVTTREAPFDGSDYERLAKQSYEWGMAQYQALCKQSKRVASLAAIVTEQQSRLLVKIQGHASGSTAHTLYRQQLDFLSRLLNVES